MLGSFEYILQNLNMTSIGKLEVSSTLKFFTTSNYNQVNCEFVKYFNEIFRSKASNNK